MEMSVTRVTHLFEGIIFTNEFKLLLLQISELLLERIPIERLFAVDIAHKLAGVVAFIVEK